MLTITKMKFFFSQIKNDQVNKMKRCLFIVLFLCSDVHIPLELINL